VNWLDLRRATPARIGLGRAGTGLPTAAHLDFQAAHARARDAVHAAFDGDGIAAGLAALGLDAVRLHSCAGERATYLRRPDLGRRLDPASRAALARAPQGGIAFVVADGLSPQAAGRHAVPLIAAVLARWGDARPALTPVAVVAGGRVAIGDEIGGLLGAELAAVLIGERPGLTSPDSLGVYLTWQPAPGAVDAARNCLSNIRPEGMPIAAAAEALVRLIAAARRHRMTGIGLSRRLAPPSGPA
jgi:ethanolamine ammonia-lyase small subunit